MNVTIKWHSQHKLALRLRTSLSLERNASCRRRGGLAFFFVCVGRSFSVRYRSPKEPAPVTGFWCLAARRVSLSRQSSRSRALTQPSLFTATPNVEEPQRVPARPPGLRRVRRDRDDDKEHRNPHPITRRSVARGTINVLRLLDLGITSVGVQTEHVLSDAGRPLDLHVSCLVSDHAPSCHVPGVPRGRICSRPCSLQDSASMPRDLVASLLVPNPVRNRRIL